MRELGDSLGINLANVATSFDWAGPVLTALDTSPICDVDPSCTGARGQLQRFVTARDDGTFDKVADLARQLQWTQDSQTVESSTKGLQQYSTTPPTPCGHWGWTIRVRCRNA